MADIVGSGDPGGFGAWVQLDGGLECWFGAPSQAAGAEFIAGIAELVPAGPAADCDLRGTGVRVRIPFEHPGPGSTLTDTISELARGAGLRPEPTAVQRIGIEMESPEPAGVIGYWRLVCGYQRSGDDLVDGLRRDPRLRFTTAGEPRPLRNRIHLDVNAGRAFTPDRIAELERTGGRIVKGSISADADGNEACIPFGAPPPLDDAADLADWRQLMGAMVRYSTASLHRATALATAAARVADAAGKPLIIDIRRDDPAGRVTVIIDSGKDQQENESFRLDAGFGDLARAVQSAARDLGLVADPDSGLRHLQVAIDAFDIPAVQRFWLAALRYRLDPRSFVTDIVDPRRRGPVVWFQQLDGADEARRAQRNRLRLRLAVPQADASTRLASALANGGVIIDGSRALGRWRIADPEGNELELVAG